MKIQKRLASIAIALAVLVIVLGAYTRLTDAGLACPDWPGCYGSLAVPQSAHMERAAQLYPDTPLEPQTCLEKGGTWNDDAGECSYAA